MPRRAIPGGGKKVPLNMRTTVGLRRKIERAAGASGRSMVQEVEHRLERSFHADEAWREIERFRRHVLGMLAVLDGKVVRIERSLNEKMQDLSDSVRVFHARQLATQQLQHETRQDMAEMRKSLDQIGRLMAATITGKHPEQVALEWVDG